MKKVESTRFEWSVGWDIFVLAWVPPTPPPPAKADSSIEVYGQVVSLPATLVSRSQEWGWWSRKTENAALRCITTLLKGLPYCLCLPGVPRSMLFTVFHHLLVQGVPRASTVLQLVAMHAWELSYPPVPPVSHVNLKDVPGQEVRGAQGKPAWGAVSLLLSSTLHFTEVNCSFFLLYEQRALHFYFALSPTNHVACPVVESYKRGKC